MISEPPAGPVPAASAAPWRPAAWSDAVRSSFFPLALSMARCDPAELSMQTKVRAGCRLARIRAPAHLARMREADCDSLDGRYLKVLWLPAGQAEFRQRGTSLPLAAGQWLLYEASRPYEIDVAAGAELVVMLAAVRPQDHWLQATRDGALVARPIEDAARLALDVVRSALSDAVGLAPSTCAAFTLGVRGLLEAAVQHGHSGVPGAAGAAAQAQLVQGARARMLQQLDSPELGPDDLAAQLRVSRRTLYKAFEAAGDTPQACLLRLRLERCRALLLAPGGQRLNLTRLAMDHGFSDAAYFSRAYKKRFGHPPSRALHG